MKSSSAALVTIDSIIDKKIYLNFSRFHRFYTQKNSRNIVFFPIVLLGFAIYNWWIGNNILGWILLAFCLLMPVWSLTTFHLNTIKQVKRFNLEVPRIFYSIIFSEKGIKISNNRENAEYEWSQVYKIYRTQSSIYLYLTPVNAFIIPISCVKVCTADELWVLFQKHISNKKLISKKSIFG